MTKKKRSGRGRKGQEGLSEAPPDFDSLSMASSNNSGFEDGSESDVFEDAVERLSETRLATRLQGMRELLNLLASNVLQEECASRETTLCRAFSQAIKRGREEIQCLAARGFSLLVLSLGLDDSTSNVWETIQSDLIPKSLSGKSLVVRSASLEALALGCFVVEDDFFRIQPTMESMRALWKNENAKLVTAAVRGWTLVLTSLNANMIANSTFETEMTVLGSLLESQDGELQEAAGIALALLHTLGIGTEEDEDVSEIGSDNASVGTSVSQMDEMRDRMKDLSAARGPRKSKKSRAFQKAAFRNICSFIEDGEMHVSKIKLQYGDVLTVDSLQKHIQMTYFRSVLGSGFHRHLHENTLLHRVFNYRPRSVMEQTRLSKAEKRYQRSPSSWSTKLRKQTRDWERSEKQVYLQSGNLCNLLS